MFLKIIKQCVVCKGHTRAPFLTYLPAHLQYINMPIADVRNLVKGIPQAKNKYRAQI
jgi:hypothetical protein